MSVQSVCAFEFESDADARVMVVSLAGKLDPVAAEDLNERVEDAFQTGFRRFVFDLSRLDYVGSMGLRLFVGLHNRVRGEGAVALSNPTTTVLTILDMTKLNRVLRYYPSRREAVDALVV